MVHEVGVQRHNHSATYWPMEYFKLTTSPVNTRLERGLHPYNSLATISQTCSKRYENGHPDSCVICTILRCMSYTTILMTCRFFRSTPAVSTNPSLFAETRAPEGQQIEAGQVEKDFFLTCDRKTGSLVKAPPVVEELGRTHMCTCVFVSMRKESITSLH